MKKIFYVLKTENIQLLKDWIENGFDASFDNNWLIKYASANGHSKFIKFLSALPNVDASAKDNWALKTSIKYEHKEVANFLSNLDCVKNSLTENDYQIFQKIY